MVHKDDPILRSIQVRMQYGCLQDKDSLLKAVEATIASMVLISNDFGTSARCVASLATARSSKEVPPLGSWVFGLFTMRNCGSYVSPPVLTRASEYQTLHIATAS